MAGAIAAGIGPALLIFFAMYAARNERVWGLNALLFAALVGVSGAVVYGSNKLFRSQPKDRSST